MPSAAKKKSVGVIVESLPAPSLRDHLDRDSRVKYWRLDVHKARSHRPKRS